MKNILILLFLITFNVNAQDNCYTLNFIEKNAKMYGGSVDRLTYENIHVLVHSKSLPEIVLNLKGKWYVEYRGIEKVRIFNMLNGCAHRQFVIPVSSLENLTYRLSILINKKEAHKSGEMHGRSNNKSHV